VISTGGDFPNNVVALVWDWANDAVPLVLYGQGSSLGPFSPAMFLPGDGRRVFAVGSAGLRVWACDACAPLEDVFRLATRRVTRELTPDERSVYGLS
jgi:hypothetical protein